MTVQEAAVGHHVKSLVAFAGIPSGTRGIIDEDYWSGVMAAWDYPRGILPLNYAAYDGVWAVVSGITRDGFDKATELHYLQPIEDAEFEVIDNPKQLTS